ncbi:MAG: hypothetical protein ACRDRF_24130, partial [Pseudonocardiaceae bacterium]
PRSPHVRFLNRLGGRLLVFVWVGDTVNSKAIVWRWAAACGGWDSLAYPSHDGIGGGSGRDPPRGEHYRCTRASVASSRTSPTFLDKLIYSSFPLVSMGAGAGLVYYPCQRLGA